MTARYEDWLRQAIRDLGHAKHSLNSGDYEWACFAAQQSAEKGLKALFLKNNRSAWGHSVAGLLQELHGIYDVERSLIDAGKELDKHYIPPRYPNSYPEGAPYDYYTKAEAERAIAHTEQILEFCKGFLAEPQASEDPSGTGGGASDPNTPGN